MSKKSSRHLLTVFKMEERLKSQNVDPHPYTTFVFIVKFEDQYPIAAADLKPKKLLCTNQALCRNIDFSIVLTEFILMVDIQTFHDLKLWKHVFLPQLLLNCSSGMQMKYKIQQKVSSNAAVFSSSMTGKCRDRPPLQTVRPSEMSASLF